MASTINSSTSNGIVITPDTSGEIELQASGTTITSITANGMAVDTNTLYVDATNNRVGIGTSSPSEKFHVSDTSTSTVKSRTQASTGYVDIGMGGNSGVFDTTASDGIRLRLSGNDAVAVTSSGEINFVKSGSLVKYRFNSGSDPYLSSGSIGCAYFNASSSDATAYAIVTNKDSASTMHHICFKNLNSVVGTISTTNYNTAYNTSSDYRLKENITPMTGGINKVKLLKPCTWTWIGDGSFGQGFVAHEAQEVVSEAVHGTKDEVNDEGNPVYQGIDQSKLVPLLTAALQEAITKIEDLESRIQALESA